MGLSPLCFDVRVQCFAERYWDYWAASDKGFWGGCSILGASHLAEAGPRVGDGQEAVPHPRPVHCIIQPVTQQILHMKHDTSQH